jgi:DivIVA domain-containing protein
MTYRRAANSALQRVAARSDADRTVAQDERVIPQQERVRTGTRAGRVTVLRSPTNEPERGDARADGSPGGVAVGRTGGGAAKLDGVSARGRSLSMFVVQRSFRWVRRGYDPDEVDRHLQLVSQWFTSTDVGRAFTKQRTELEQRERAVAAREAEQARHVEGARLEADATLEGARRRADAAAAAADRTLADAGAEAARIRRDAEQQRVEILDRARAQAAAADVVRRAEERATEMLRDARADAERILAEAHEAVERELTVARQQCEQRLRDARAEAAQLAERLRAQAEDELRIYTDRRRREADRLAEAARRQPRSPRS